jgi:hypothetical protein
MLKQRNLDKNFGHGITSKKVSYFSPKKSPEKIYFFFSK